MSCNLSETLAAGRIIDVMTGGKFDWRARLEDSDFLESGDWLTALAYARAALPQPPAADAGEVRTYREGVEDAAKVAEGVGGSWDYVRKVGDEWHPGSPYDRGRQDASIAIAAAIRKLG